MDGGGDVGGGGGGSRLLSIACMASSSPVATAAARTSTLAANALERRDCASASSALPSRASTCEQPRVHANGSTNWGERQVSSDGGARGDSMVGKLSRAPGDPSRSNYSRHCKKALKIHHDEHMKIQVAAFDKHVPDNRGKMALAVRNVHEVINDEVADDPT